MERRLKCYRHVMRREEEIILRKVPRMDTRKKEDGTTKNKMDGSVCIRHEEYRTLNEQGDWQKLRQLEEGG